MDSGSVDGDVPILELADLKVITILGRGSRGLVFLGTNRYSGECLALKTIPKTVKNTSGSGHKRINFERSALTRFRHPLLPSLQGVFESNEYVAYAIDYCPGRDMHSLRNSQVEKTFSNDIIRFYGAELVIALEYLHELGVVYRDLKPDHIMIQQNGHIMLVDFDLSTTLPLNPHQTPPASPTNLKNRTAKSLLSRIFWCSDSDVSPHNQTRVKIPYPNTRERANSFVGTEEYVAPEVIAGRHGFGADWWSYGVVLYEMLYGRTPFRGSNRKETFYRILSKSPDLSGETTPLRGLIRRLLEKDPRKRIPVREIKGHDFFRGVDWDSVLEIQRPPFIPEHTELVDGNGGDVEEFVRRAFNFQTNSDEYRNTSNDCYSTF